MQAVAIRRERQYYAAKKFRFGLYSRVSPGKGPGSETLGIIVEKQSIRKKYLTALFKLCCYGLQSPRSPVGLHKICDALVAQLDRVLASEAKGRGFESRPAHHEETRD